MSSDQASGLRQWSRAHAARDDARPASVELVVMTWQGRDAGLDALVPRLALPDSGVRWQPRELTLSASLPDSVPDSPWWMLHLTQLEAHCAPKLAEALRVLHRAGMPRTVLLIAPESRWASGLVSAAWAHLGVSLVPEVRGWHQAVTAARAQR